MFSPHRHQWMWIKWPAVQERPVCQHDRPLPVHLWHRLQIYRGQTLLRWYVSSDSLLAVLRVSERCRSTELCIFVLPQTSTSVPLKMAAVRPSAPTLRAVTSAAATLDMHSCPIWEPALVRSFAFIDLLTWIRSSAFLCTIEICVPLNCLCTISLKVEGNWKNTWSK